MLPDEDGMTILGKLKADVNFKNIPVIMLTAKTSELDKVARVLNRVRMIIFPSRLGSWSCFQE